jgi:hypothetical protein
VPDATDRYRKWVVTEEEAGDDEPAAPATIRLQGAL